MREVLIAFLQQKAQELGDAPLPVREALDSRRALLSDALEEAKDTLEHLEIARAKTGEVLRRFGIRCPDVSRWLEKRLGKE